MNSTITFFPPLRRMIFSAQKSSGVHWCSDRVRFNDVPKNVPKVPEKVPGKLWCRARTSSTRFRGRFQRSHGRLWCKARSGSTRFRKRFRRRFQEALVQSQVGLNSSGEGSGEGRAGFGAEPGQVQQGFGECSGEGSGEGSGRLWCSARWSLTGFRRRFRKRSGKLWCTAGQVQQGSGEGSGEGLGGFGAEPSLIREGSGESSEQGNFGAEPGQVQQGSGKGLQGFGAAFQRLASQHASQKCAKQKCCSCCGYHSTLFWYRTVFVLQ